MHCFHFKGQISVAPHCSCAPACIARADFCFCETMTAVVLFCLFCCLLVKINHRLIDNENNPQVQPSSEGCFGTETSVDFSGILLNSLNSVEKKQTFFFAFQKQGRSMQMDCETSPWHTPAWSSSPGPHWCGLPATRRGKSRSPEKQRDQQINRSHQ